MTFKNLKKVFIAFIALFVALGLGACGKEEDKKEALTAAYNSIFLGDLNSVKNDFELPTVTTAYGLKIEWQILQNPDNAIELVEKDGKLYCHLANRPSYSEDESGNEIVTFYSAVLGASVSNKSGKSDVKEFPLYVRSKENIIEGLSIAQLKANVFTYDGKEITVKSGANDVRVTFTGIVTCVGAQGFFVNDGTASIYVFAGKAVTCQVGDSVVVTGYRDIYYNAPQIGKTDVEYTVQSSGNPVDYESLKLNKTLTEIQALPHAVTDYANYSNVIKVSGKVVVGTDSSNKTTYSIVDEVSGKTLAFETSYTLTTTGKAELEAFKDKYVEGYAYLYDFHSSLQAWRGVYIEGQWQEITAPTVTDDVRVANIKAQLESSYADYKTMASMTLPSTNSSYAGSTITWVSSNTAVIGNDGTYTAPTEDTDVTLTFTITLNEATVTGTVTVKALKQTASTIAQVNQMSDNTQALIEGTVLTIGAYGMYVEDATGVIYVYGGSTKANYTTTATVGDEVSVIGTKSSYNGLVQFINTTVTVTAVHEAASPVVCAVAQEKTVEEVINGTIGTPVKVFGTVVEVTSGSYTNYYFEDGGKQVMLHYQQTGSGSSAVEALVNEIKDLIGKQVTIYAIIYSQYSSTNTLYYVSNSAVEKELTPDEKVAAAEATVKALETTYTGYGNLELETTIKGATVAWASDKTEVVAIDGTVTTPATETQVKLTATITCEGATQKVVEITVTVKALPVMTIAQATAEIDKCVDVTVCVVAKILGTDCNGYVILGDETGVLYFRQKLSTLKVDENTLEVGNVIKLTAVGTVYTKSDAEYTRQLGTVVALELSEEAVTAPVETTVTSADLPATNTSDNKIDKAAIAATAAYGKIVTITGTVYYDSTQSNNFQYFLKSGNTTLVQIYPLSTTHAYGANNKYADLVGAEVTVKGMLYGYNVAGNCWRFITFGLENEFTFTNGLSGNIEHDSDKTGGELTATVSEDKTTITFDGSVAWSSENESLGLAAGNRIGVKVTAPADVTIDDGFVLTLNGTTKDKTAATDNYAVVYVTFVNGVKEIKFVVKWNTASTPTLYTVKLADTATLQAKPAGEVVVKTATLKYSTASTTNMTGNNDAKTVGLDENEFSVVGAKLGTTSNLPGLNKNGTIRMYNNGTGNCNSITITCNTGNIISIKVTLDSSAAGAYEVNTNGTDVTGTIEGTVGTYNINANSFVITNSTAKVYITSIEITYEG